MERDMNVRKRLKIPKTTSVVLMIVGMLSVVASAQTQDPAQSTKQVTGVVAIEAYCKELDSFKKRNPNQARWFGDVAPWDQSGTTLNAPAVRWKEFKSRKARESAATDDNLFDVADLWMRDGRVVI